MIPHHDPTNLRLEVETPGTGLPNLVRNPSGEKGTWAWVTPVANTLMTTVGSSALKFTTSTSQACHFTSEFLPVAATKWVAAQVTVVGQQTGHNIKCRFEWYNASKVLLSSSTQTGAFSHTAGLPTPSYVPPVQAPANTAYVKVRADLYNGTGNPLANAYVQFRSAMVTWQDTNTFTTVRTNLLTNPSMETNATGWFVDTNCTLARGTSTPHVGTAYLSMTATATASTFLRSASGTSGVPVTAGADYAIQFHVRCAAVPPSGETIVSSVRWYNAAGGLVTITNGPSAAGVSTAYVQGAGVVTAPSGAAFATLVLGSHGLTGSQELRFDALHFEKASSAGGYFDGSTTDTGTAAYDWTGTAHASTSTETVSTWAYAEPYAWRNILAPTFEIGIDRNSLDVGTLLARISDPGLDPATATDVRPGRQARLRALVDGEWTSVFEGKIRNAQVDYDTKTPGRERTLIALTAVDNIATLANRAEVRGVATIGALPYLLEDKGVPWSANGSGNQITSATQVSANENATMLDQVAVTRDTALGYAWVDRNNVLQVWDAAQLPSAPAVTYTDVPSADPAFNSYSDIDADFDTARCINEVTVKFLRYNAATGQTEEIPYGPYRDQASIDEWGAFSAEFTIHDTVEAAISIAAYATSILTANATPTRRANAITVPVVDARSLRHAATVDLYTLVHVTYSDKVNEDYRVTSLVHTITPEKWTTGYTFDVSGSVASPQVTPSPPTGRVAVGYAVRRVVTASRTSNTTVSAAAYNITTATLPYPINGARYRVLAQANVNADTAGAFTLVQVKHGASASTGGTQVGEFLVDHRVANRRQGAAVPCEFVYTGTTGAANYNVVLVGEPSGGSGQAVASATSPATLTVDEVG